MIYDGKKSPNPIFAKLANLPFFATFYKRFAPKMRLGNQPDMPTITTDRLWFLRENRFLFLTRDGPIEVTLKPSFVLTGILVCMAGVAAIFYYTLIASYSAIEVMRDETIQTAKASSSIQHAEVANTDVMTWKEYHPSYSLEGLSLEINEKHSQTSRSIISPIKNKPSISVPELSRNDKSLDSVTNDYFPIIIQGGKRVTFSDEEAESSKTLSGQLPSRELVEETIKATLPGDSRNTKKTMITNNNASPALTNQKHISDPLIHADARVDATSTPETEILAKPLLMNSAALAQATQKDEEKEPGLTTRAQEFAVALLPAFIAKPDPIEPNTDSQKIQDLPRNKENAKRPELANVAKIIPDDGLSTNRDDTQTGPILPIVSEAARIRKMLLTYRQEIDYIRSTVTSLGISQDALPTPPLLKNQKSEQTTDKEFRSLMIKLAEHRAALRKIPFKPPMLYFYISSGYGMRKHPKTGKSTFHHGIDLAGTWQENVRATAPGKVIYAGTEGAFGKVVRVQHEFGVATTYAHLARITVRLGDYVSENHVVGKMGNTGRSVGAHLHYEIRVNGKSIDPDKFMKVGRKLSVAGELRQSALID